MEGGSESEEEVEIGRLEAISSGLEGLQIEDHWVECDQKILDQIETVFLYAYNRSPLSQQAFNVYKDKIDRLLEKREVIIEEVTGTLSGQELREFSLSNYRIEDQIRQRTNTMLKSVTIREIPTPPEPRGQCHHRGAKIKLECPTFSGEVGGDKFAYRNFLAKFQYCVEEASSDKERLVLLKTKLNGRAFNLISGLGCSEENYLKALQILRKHFYNEDSVREAVLKRIAEFECRGLNPDKLGTTILEISHQLNELDREFEYGFTTQSGSNILIGFLLFRTFPGWLRDELMRRARNDFPTWKDIEEHALDAIRTCSRRLPVSERKPGPYPVASLPKGQFKRNVPQNFQKVKSRENSICISTRISEEEIMLPIIRVKISWRGGCHWVNCLLDSGSQKTILSSEILDKLRCPDLVREKISYDVITINHKSHRQGDLVTVGVQIFPGRSIFTPIIFQPNLLIKNPINFKLISDNLKLKGFNLDPYINSCSFYNIQGIVGVDLFKIIPSCEIIKCLKGNAFSLGGKIVPFGSTSNFLSERQLKKVKPIETTIGLNYTNTLSSVPKPPEARLQKILYPIPSYVDPCRDQFCDSQVERGLESLFSLESIGIQDTEIVSTADAQQISKFREAISHQDGHYLVQLPWDYEKLRQVNSNHHIALNILHRVFNKLTSRGLYQAYLEEFETQEKLGIIEEIFIKPKDFVDYIWIPHRPVLKFDEFSTTKIRPVFNCSLKGKSGISLNDAAYPGVNLTTDMLRLLLDFRSNSYVLLGDLKKAFLMVRLKEEEDQNRFCFFLKKGNSLHCYRYKTILFGFVASPFILSYVLQHHASQYPDDACSVMLSKNFYVDNLVKTGNDENILKDLYVEASHRMLEGGFELRECNSNSRILRQKMEEDHTLSEADGWVKVLGYRYSPSTDNIRIADREVDINANTKRSILSGTSQIFDPLSLCLPVTIRGRLLMRELWKLKVEWDQPVPMEFQGNWQKLAKDLNGLKDILFPRCAVIECKCTELYIFCDASKQAYGFTAYAVTPEGSRLIFAKAKVAPFRNRSLPTLELLGVFLAHKCLPTILDCLQSTKINKIFIAIDAQVVLSWILSKSTSSNNIFLNNRLSDITSFENQLWEEYQVVLQYRYVSTEDNPSDLLTRGLSTKQFCKKLDFWLTGPEWLKSYPVSWPSKELNCLSPENKKVISCHTDVIAENTTEPIVPFDRFSSYLQLVRVTQLCLQFVSKLKGFHDDDCLEASHIYLLKVMQRQCFQEELDFLKNPTGRSAPSRVLNLQLFLDQQGLIRCRGRIEKADVFGFDVRNPILLAEKSSLTKLIVMHCHRGVQHMATAATLNKIRSNGYWIPRIRQVVSTILRKCALCRRHNYGPYSYPKVADLPADRVELVRPFDKTGIDFTGHFFIETDYQPIKMYVLVFTCLSIRAVHFELVPDMSATSFILAFTRFSNRYGVPSTIYSDNAKSFILGCEIITECAEFQQRFGTHQIRHRRIPRFSPWFGGVWERLIGVLKKCFYKIIGRRRLNFFEFNTFLSDVQKAVNDRPLTYRCSGDMNLDTISPNHFLQPGNCPQPELRLADGSLTAECLPGRRVLVQTLENREVAHGHFRQLWYEAYLLSLRERHTSGSVQNFQNKIEVGDIVVIKLPNKPRPFWMLGRVLEVYMGADGLIRTVKVRKGDGEEGVFAIKHLYPLELSISDDDPNEISEHSDNHESFSNDISLLDENSVPLYNEDYPRPESSSEDICPECNDGEWAGTSAVQCDHCDHWFHYSCAGLLEDPPEEDDWICRFCLSRQESSSEDVCPECSETEWAGTCAVQCDRCDQWFHYSCAGLLEDPPGEEEWICRFCLSRHGTSIFNLGLTNRPTRETYV